MNLLYQAKTKEQFATLEEACTKFEVKEAMFQVLVSMQEGKVVLQGSGVKDIKFLNPECVRYSHDGGMLVDKEGFTFLLKPTK